MEKSEKDRLHTYLMGIVSSLPECPGCYQYLDETGTIIYVGKAKNLKRRVYSYFSKEHDSRKTAILVSKIRDIKYIVVKTEEDALLLENNLIKQWSPRYNILLKDGKTYPSIVVTNEYLPRIFQTRKIDKRLGTFYGPYSHVPTMSLLLELIGKLYPLRRCREHITADSIAKNKHKECLEYHIKNCKAPCTKRQSHDEYMQNIAEAKEILKGNTAQLERQMLQRMQEHAAKLQFEEAEAIKRKYLLLENYRSKSEVVSSTLHNIDVFNIENNEKVAYINYLHVTNGCITQAFTFEYAKRLEETDEELLTLGIVEMRHRYGSQSKEIVVPFHVELPENYALINIPQKGDKRKLLELSKLNVKQYKFDRLKQAEKLNPEQKQTRLMKEFQRDLGLEKLPMHIELFDNSNIQGEDAVAACVVFKRLKPSKQDYRKYHIKTVVGPDDYASMKEVVFRRYSRLMEEGAPLPDLIIADGGKGQMEVIRQVTEEMLHLQIPIAGLAKDDKHRTHELLFGFPQKSIGLSPNSQLFRTLTAMQDEVHRFAITFHRDQRSKRMVKSELDQVSGIGPRARDILLQPFGSVNKVKEADLEAFQKLLGQQKGKNVFENLHKIALES